MKKLLTVHSKKVGFTLMEIVLAIAIIAMAFIPIMSIFGHNFKITEKDKSNIEAVNLCKDRLDTALKMRIDVFKIPSGSSSVQYENDLIDVASEPLKLDLRDYTHENITYHFVFNVSNRPDSFTVNPRVYDNDDSQDPLLPSVIHIGSKQTIEYSNLVKRYRMTVYWYDKGIETSGRTAKNPKHSYTLQTFQAKYFTR